jgi:outer membrane beta-barrel protein
MRHTLKVGPRHLGAALLVVLSATTTAQADRRNPLEGQPPIRHKVEMRKLRFEISPQFFVSLNQDFKHFLGGGATLQFHITDWLGITATIAGGGGVNTGLSDRLSSGDQAVLPAMERGLQPSREQFQAHLATINMMFDIGVAITPMAGKLALFGAAFLRYDLYAIIGIGGLNMANGWSNYIATHAPTDNDEMCLGQNPNHCDPSNSGFKFGGVFGIGVHLYFTKWIGMNVEVRDFVVSSNPAGLDVNGDRKVDGSDSTISNNFMLGLGLTIMLPPSPKISP